MDERAKERTLMLRCLAAIRCEPASKPVNAVEGNLFRAAAMVLQPRFPQEAQRLREISDEYFSEYSDQLMPVVWLVHNNHITSMPRFRDNLEHLIVAEERRHI